MKKKLSFLMGALLSASIFTGPAAMAEDPTPGGTLIMALQQTPRHLNPAVQSGTATGQPGTQLFASLLRYDDGWEPQPYLAKSWEIAEDGLSVTINLVEGATFHDGAPITSEDVAFSIDTVKANHPFKSMFAPVTAVETPDANTAIIKLSEPHPALMLAMSSQLLSIIPKHVYGDGQDPKAHPANSENVVGSGPFKLVEFKRDQHVILERYDGYFLEGLPYLDKIVALMLGTTGPALTGIHPGSPFYNESVEAYDLDLDKANAMLDEAGYAAGDDGIRFPLTVDFGWPAMKPYAEYMKPQLKKIGIDVTVRASADFPTWAKRISNWEFDMTMDNVFNWGDPVIGVHRTYNSENIKAGVIWSNTQQYSNARVDELMAAAGKTNDTEERKALYAEFQEIIADELPLYPLFPSPYHTVSNTAVVNAPNSIWGSSSPLDKVWLRQ